jgi:hypothetical protein
VTFPVKQMQELVLNIQQFDTTVPRILERRGFLLKTLLFTQKLRQILEIDKAKQNKI